MARIFHVTDRTRWQAAVESGEYVADSLSVHGFIHCSTGEQVIPVADLWFKGREGLLITAVGKNAPCGLKAEYARPFNACSTVSWSFWSPHRKSANHSTGLL